MTITGRPVGDVAQPVGARRRVGEVHVGLVGDDDAVRRQGARGTPPRRPGSISDPVGLFGSHIQTTFASSDRARAAIAPEVEVDARHRHPTTRAPTAVETWA